MSEEELRPVVVHKLQPVDTVIFRHPMRLSIAARDAIQKEAEAKLSAPVLVVCEGMDIDIVREEPASPRPPPRTLTANQAASIELALRRVPGLGFLRELFDSVACWRCDGSGDVGSPETGRVECGECAGSGRILWREGAGP